VPASAVQPPPRSRHLSHPASASEAAVPPEPEVDRPEPEVVPEDPEVAAADPEIDRPRPEVVPPGPDVVPAEPEVARPEPEVDLFRRRRPAGKPVWPWNQTATATLEQPELSPAERVSVTGWKSSEVPPRTPTECSSGSGAADAHGRDSLGAPRRPCPTVKTWRVRLDRPGGRQRQWSVVWKTLIVVVVRRRCAMSGWAGEEHRDVELASRQPDDHLQRYQHIIGALIKIDRRLDKLRQTTEWAFFVD